MRLLSFLRPVSQEDKPLYNYIKTTFGFRPVNLEIYKQALTHKSFIENNLEHVETSNERLEFLGDAVLDLIMADHLVAIFPDNDEGFLTKLRSRVVSRVHLKTLAIKINLADHLKRKDVDVFESSLLGDALEAIIGATYLENGYDFTREVVIDYLVNPYIDLEEPGALNYDFKSRLIEWVQKSKKTYSFIDSDHSKVGHEPKFQSVLHIENKMISSGFGSSKKKAQQEASRVACIKLSIPLKEV